MSKYTVELRWLVEQAEINAHGKYTPFTYTEATWQMLGLDSYPIFDESHRKGLNEKIVNHYYMREIGAETAGLFRLFMRRTMNEIMPYYNQLYETQAMIKNPLSDYEHHRVENWEIDNAENWSNTNNSESETTSENQNVYSDTPMDMLGNSGSPSVKNLDYATNVTYDDGSTLGTTKSDGSGKNDKNEGGHRASDEEGRHVSESELLDKYRKTLLNIDMMIIDELSICFMGVW